MRRGGWTGLALLLAAGCHFDSSGLATTDLARVADAAGADVTVHIDITDVTAEPAAPEPAGPEAPGPDAPGPDAAQPDVGAADALPLLLLGAPCAGAVQCASGQCVKDANGGGKICCDSACSGCDGCNNNGQGCDC